MTKLTKSMTVTQFDNGYWYTEEIKRFAKEIGVESVTKLRKDELEKLIRHFLQTGEVIKPDRKKLSKPGIKDVEKGLSLELPVINYTNNKETKEFIRQEALKIVPNLKTKSGVGYRLNRWRDEQVNNGTKINYGDVVKEYIKLSQVKGSFAKIPHGRYINFISEYLKKEKEGTREHAINAWKDLKKLDIPKDYTSWKKYRQGKS